MSPDLARSLRICGLQDGETFSVAAIRDTERTFECFINVEDALLWFSSLGSGWNCHFCGNPVRPGTSGKPKASNILEARVLVIDIDPVNNVSAPREAAFAVANFLQGVGVKPALVFSGRGHQVWVRTDGLDNSQRLKLAKGLASKCARDGAKFDGTHNRDRLQRLAGTTNLKTGAIAEIIDEGNGVAIDTAKLDALELPDVPEIDPISVPSSVGPPTPEDVALEASIKPRWPKDTNDRSMRDCNFAFDMLCEGASNETIARLLWAKTNSKYRADKRGPDYLASVLKNAHERLAREQRADAIFEKVENERPIVRLGLDISKSVDASESALASDPYIFARGGELVRVRLDERPVIEGLPRPTLTEVLSKRARFRTKKGPTKPPRDVVDALASRGVWPKLRCLRSIVDRPTITGDGRVIDEPGFDASSGILYLRGAYDYPPVKERPSFGDALAALGALREVFCDFPFVEPCDRSAALALPLSLIGRAAIDGPVPLFAIRAPARGEGKSLLADVASMIAEGRPAARTTQPKDGDEERKRLLSLGREGAAFVLIDNVERPLGSDVLAAALTARTFRDRVLGVSQTISVPVPVFAATGCNLEIKGDLGRRVVPIDLNSGVERPDERRGFRHPDLMGWLKRERPRLVSASLTILRWYFAEGCPRVELSPFGSFEAWSNVVRQPLCWLGEADPIAGRERIRSEADTANEALRVALETWAEIVGSKPTTVSDALLMAGKHRALAVALAALDERLSPDRLDEKSVGYALRRVRGRIVGGKKFERFKSDGFRRWGVVANGIDPIDPGSALPSTLTNSCTTGGLC